MKIGIIGAGQIGGTLTRVGSRRLGMAAPKGRLARRGG